MRELTKILFHKSTGYVSQNNPLKPIKLTSDQAQWLTDAGLLPMAAHLNCIIGKDEPASRYIDSALLTYRVMGVNTTRIYEDILTAASQARVQLTPLKGIDLCRRYYPDSWLRPMRDMDFLVAENNLAKVTTLLHTMGFMDKAGRPEQQTSHHEIAMYHPQRHCWVEVHRGLFPPNSPLDDTGRFAIAAISPFLCPGRIHPDVSEDFLQAEFLVVYLACHWAEDLNYQSGALGLLDLALVITKTHIDWDTVYELASHSLIAGYLCLAITVLDTLLPGLVPIPVKERLTRQAPHLNPLNTALCRILITRYMFSGNRFSVLTRHTVPLFVAKLLRVYSPGHNLASASCSLFAPHHGKLPLGTSLLNRWRSLQGSFRRNRS